MKILKAVFCFEADFIGYMSGLSCEKNEHIIKEKETELVEMLYTIAYKVMGADEHLNIWYYINRPMRCQKGVYPLNSSEIIVEYAAYIINETENTLELIKETIKDSIQHISKNQISKKETESDKPYTNIFKYFICVNDNDVYGASGF